MNDPFRYVVAFDPKDDLPLSFTDRDNFSNLGQVTKGEFELIHLMDVVAHDKNRSEGKHCDPVGLNVCAKSMHSSKNALICGE